MNVDKTMFTYVRACIIIVVVVQSMHSLSRLSGNLKPLDFSEREKKTKQEDVLRGARGVQLAN